MIKIYTPEQWHSIFGGCPTLIVDDQNRIWQADAYYKPLLGEPSGLIDYNKNRIYGPDYAKMGAIPIARMESRNGEIRIYNYEDGWSASPMLYIIGDRIYTPDQYFTAGMGGDATGFMELDREREKPFEAQPKRTEKKESSPVVKGGVGIGGLENLGCFGLIVAFLLLGKILDYLPDLPLLVWIVLAAAVVIIRKLIIDGSRKSGTGTWLADQLSSMGAGGWILVVFLFIVGFSALSEASVPAEIWLMALKRLAIPALLIVGAVVFYFRKPRR